MADRARRAAPALSRTSRQNTRTDELIAELRARLEDMRSALATATANAETWRAAFEREQAHRAGGGRRHTVFFAARFGIIPPSGAARHSPAKIKELITCFVRRISNNSKLSWPAAACQNRWPASSRLQLSLFCSTCLLARSVCPEQSPTLINSSPISHARTRSRPLVLESMIEQIEILNGLPRETERDLLIAVLRRADRSEDFVETEIARYAEGDIGGLLVWLQSAEPVRGIAQAQIPPAFVDRLITLRNHRMRDRALSLLRRGGAFIAVGAVHLPGKEGLLSLFETEGYHVDALE